MKRTIAILSITIACMVTIFASCNKTDTTDDKLRDVSFNAQVTGAFTQNIDFTLESGVANSQGIGVSAGYLSSQNKLSVNVTGGSTWSVVLGIDATSITTGNYSPNVFTMYFNSTVGSQFMATSGSINITSAESTAPLGKATDRYISGTYNITMANTDNPPKQVNATGSFQNVCVVTQ